MVKLMRLRVGSAEFCWIGFLLVLVFRVPGFDIGLVHELFSILCLWVLTVEDANQFIRIPAI